MTIHGLEIVAYGLFLHEIGHMAAAEMCGLPVVSLTFSLKHLGIGLMRAPGTPWQNFFIALAGPIVNLILCAAYLPTNPSAAIGNLVFALLNLTLPHSDGRKAVAYLRSMRGEA